MAECVSVTEVDARARLAETRAAERVRRVLDRLDRTGVDRMATDLGQAIARRRGAIGLSQRELALRCGTTQSAIARLESGSTQPRLSTLLRLAEALECDLSIELSPRPS